jgi:hypothetical protein
MTTKSSRVGSLSRRHALGVLVAPFAVSALGGAATAATLDEIKKRGYLIVATEDDFVPSSSSRTASRPASTTNCSRTCASSAPFEVKQEIIPWTGLWPASARASTTSP